METCEVRRRLVAALALGLLVASFVACGGDESASLEDQSAPTDISNDRLTSESPGVTPGPAENESSGPITTVTSTPGYVAKPPRPGRAAEPSTSGPLRFEKIRIQRDPETGEFLGQVNVVNRTDDYLNDVEFDWSIVADGDVLDGSRASWPSLAPGETVTVQLDGSARFDPHWEAVRFDYVE